MEPTKTITKEFNCKKHAGEKIEKVSLIEGTKVLYCSQCVLKIEEKEVKDALLPIHEFVQNAAAYFQKLTQQGPILKGDPPQDLLAVLDNEDEVVKKLSAHIEAEKFKVEISFGELVQTFTLLCNKAKHELLNSLDNQLFNFRNNYHYFKKKINWCYRGETLKESSAFTAEMGIASAINNCGAASELEAFIEKIKDEIYENKRFDTLTTKTGGISNLVKEMKNSVKLQEEKLPKTLFSDPMELKNMIEKLQKTLNDFVDEVCFIDNEIAQLSSCGSDIIRDSRIIKNPEDVEMIRNWLSSKPSSLKFKLLLRGSTDGFKASTFHKICDNKKNTLVLVKTEFGKICGGFTELEWNVTSSYKSQSNSFLFSVDQKTKFPLKNESVHQYSISANGGNLPTFGGGCDLYLANECNKNTHSYSKLGHTYGSENSDGKMNNTITGGENFRVIEYEVYQVEGYKSFLRPMR